MRSAGRIVFGVLIASVAVAMLLAFQAITAARSRQAVSEAMLRQYAQLAASEFARIARRDIETSLTRTLSGYIHPGRHAGDAQCNCAPLADVDYWFEVHPNGAIVERSGAMPAELRSLIAQHASGGRGGMIDSASRLRPLGAGSQQLLALRWEPHVGEGGGQIGLVARTDALEPLLALTYKRAALLPAALVDNRDARGLVDLRVADDSGRALFTSPETTPGPQTISTELFPNDAMGLHVRASMTPAFVASLGPEHTGGFNTTLVIGLAMVNALMVAVGLWQLRRERELARLRDDFVAGVSHELRTPLAQIRMFADTLLLERIRNPTEGRRALEIIGQETRRLSQLVENVLYFHRHRRVPVAAPAAPIDLRALVVDVAEGFKPLAASRRVRIEIRIPADDVIAVGTTDGMRQVLLNLLDNAVKFGPTDDVVTVALETRHGSARLIVEDRGHGVPAAERQRIFEPFERGRAPGGAGGAGIGLAVVRQIAAEHGGTVAVEDGASGGARFIVTLPGLAGDARDTAPAARAG